VFGYGGNSVDMIITYNDAGITFDAGGDWSPGQSATITVNDPDQNRNPTSAETLAVGDETAVIPTIKMGTGGLTLAEGVNLGGDGDQVGTGIITSTATCLLICVGDDDSGAASYTVSIANTTDNSERLRVIHASEQGDMSTATSTWINVTTGHRVSELINLGGTVVLSYDISAPADLVGSTAITVNLLTTGTNASTNKLGIIDLVTSGNAKSGVVDLAGGSGYGSIVNTDVSDATLAGTAAHTAFVGLAFNMSHAAAADMDSDADYAIYADFCNFDQDNGSLTHNCMYR